MPDESKQQKAWRVVATHKMKEGPEKEERTAYVLEPIYYGSNEDGLKVGDVLVPGEVKS